MEQVRSIEVDLAKQGFQLHGACTVASVSLRTSRQHAPNSLSLSRREQGPLPEAMLLVVPVGGKRN